MIARADEHLFFGQVRLYESVTPTAVEAAAYNELLNRGASFAALGRLVESFVVTPEKLVGLGQKADAIPLQWWVGLHVEDADVWRALTSGDVELWVSFEKEAVQMSTTKKQGVKSVRTAVREAFDALIEAAIAKDATLTRAEAVEQVAMSDIGSFVYRAHARSTALGLPDDALQDEVPLSVTKIEPEVTVKISRRIRELMAGPRGLSRQDAEAQVFRDDPDLYDEYRRLSTAGISRSTVTAA